MIMIFYDLFVIALPAIPDKSTQVCSVKKSVHIMIIMKICVPSSKNYYNLDDRCRKLCPHTYICDLITNIYYEF